MNRVKRYRMLLVTGGSELADRVNTAVRASGTSIEVVRAEDPDVAAALRADRDFDLVACEAGGSGADYGPVRAVAGDLPAVAVASRPGNSDPAAVLAGGLDAIAYVDLPGHLDTVMRREVDRHRRLTRAEAALAENRGGEDDWRRLFESSSDALALCEAGILVESNEAWRDLFGDTLGTEGASVLECFAGTNTAQLKKALRGELDAEVEVKAHTADMGKIGARLIVRGMDTGRQLLLARGTGRASQLAELRLREAFDLDTGLKARAQMLQALAGGTEASLVLVRVDGFSEIIERIGHAGADAALRQLAGMILERADGRHDAYRLDGTTFGVLVHGNDAEPSAVESWTQALREVVAKAIFEHGNQSTTLTVSIGVRHKVHERSESALDEAWNALREARAKGDQVVTHYDAAEMSEAERNALDEKWAARIRQAVKHNQFRLACQKVTELAGDEDTGNIFDVLLRLKNDHGEDSLPGEFMPSAERAGLSLMIDRWVINEALQLLSRPGNPGRDSTFLVRLTDASLADDNLRTWLDQLLSKRPGDSGRMVIEITDSQVESHLKQVDGLARTLREHASGTLLAFTGFDAGSVQLMERLPLDFIKLDARFIAKAGEDTRKLIRESLGEAAGRGTLAIASNIEDANTMAQLWQLGVTHVQGFYLQEPEVVVAAGDAAADDDGD